MKDRYKLDLFYQNKIDFFQTKEITPELYSVETLRICLFFDNKEKKQQLKLWSEVLPHLTNLKAISLVHPTDQAFFEIICNLSRLETLYLSSLKINDISPIENLKSLKHLQIESCHRFNSISPLLSLKKLQYLRLENVLAP